MTRSSLALSALLVALGTTAQAANFDIEAGTLQVSGEAKISVPNTAASVQFGVQTQSLTSRAAVEQNSATLQSVIEKVLALGVDQEDIKTSAVSLRPVYSNSKSPVNQTGETKVVGYTMSNNVSVTVDNLTILGDVLAAATDAGVNRIDSVSLIPDPSAINNDQLRRLAAQDAKTKAEAYEIIGERNMSVPRSASFS